MKRKALSITVTSILLMCSTSVPGFASTTSPLLSSVATTLPNTNTTTILSNPQESNTHALVSQLQSQANQSQSLISNTLQTAVTDVTSNSSGTTSNSQANPVHNQPSAWTPEPATYGIALESNVPITMSDGTVLMTDIYRPAELTTGQAVQDKFPVILSETPYRKTGLLTQGGDGYYPYLVQRGYINVIVDVRGTGSSQGSWQFFGPQERQDSVKLVNWCSKQLQGSNGIVGMAGASYLGINQLYTAALVGKNSPLKAIFPVIASNDLYRDTAFDGGLIDAEFTYSWLGQRDSLDALPSDNATSDPFYAFDVAANHAAGTLAMDSSLVGSILSGGDKSFDGEFWNDRAPRNYLARIVENNIPAFLVGGWFDIFQRGEPLNFAGLQNAYAALNAGKSTSEIEKAVNQPMSPTQKVTGRYQLVMGPWYHLTATVGQKLQELQLEWFDTWLKGKNTGMENTENPMHLFELSSKRWIDTARYPFVQSNVQTYYLSGGKSGTVQSLNDGYLLPTAPNTNNGSDTIAWSGISSPFSRNTEQWSAGIYSMLAEQAGLPPAPYTQDDRTVEANGLTYTTQPLQKAQTLAGPINVTLYATATSSNAEFIATIEDVAPDGTAYPLTSGALIGSQRAVDPTKSWYDNKSKALMMPFHPFTAASNQSVTPGKVERYDLEVYPTFANIEKGHRIRLTITTSDTPHLMPNQPQLAGLVGGNYQIQRSTMYASSVNLPLADPNQFNDSNDQWGPSGQ